MRANALASQWVRFFPKRLSLTRRKPALPDQGASTPVSQKCSNEGLSGPHDHSVGPGRSTTPLSTRWTRLGLSGRLWTPTTDRAALAPGSLSFLAGPGVGCSHRMCRLPPLAGNLALLFAAHRSEATASTFRCLHVFLLFLSTEDLGFDSHASRKGLSSPTRIPPSRGILQMVPQHHRLVGNSVVTQQQAGQERGNASPFSSRQEAGNEAV